ncbi:hypothetical protein BJP34_01585 [Moorena producens PAL-8-15-08-1]|uniref:Uncharacterized protein n=1 Tax=Moorena producens PAL-8-15-08-1 TaxID=1458985 RepID=A0A1D8TKY5_9CYAN|nr:hypothetical protein BJP34_01585 [Moorena producens PAL-8-15-08-1]
MLGFWITQSNNVRLFDERLTSNQSQFDTAQAAFNARLRSYSPKPRFSITQPKLANPKSNINPKFNSKTYWPNL